MRGETFGYFVIDLAFTLEFFRIVAQINFFFYIDNAKNEVVFIIAESAYEPERMVNRLSVDQKAVFIALHRTFFHSRDELVFLQFICKDMPVIFVDHHFSVTDHILEEILAALFDVK